VPLDPLRTFHHYVMTHGFGQPSREGKKNPLQLRVSFGSEEYERRNHRLRNFKKENSDRESRIEDKNEAKTCFGFAKYEHRGDGSVEWRPVFVTRPEDYGEAKRKYQVEWVFTPSLSQEPELIDEDKVVLAPTNPQIRGAGSLEHMEILMQAKKLHEVEQLDESAITVRLNEILTKKYERQKKAEEDRGVKDVRPKPVPISEMDVKYFLASRNVEAEAQGMEMNPEPSEAGTSSAAVGGSAALGGRGFGSFFSTSPPGAGTGLGRS